MRRNTVEDRIRGLNLGADDYLVKPFAFHELLARVHALVRRRYRQKSPTITLGDIQIDTTRKSVAHQGKFINLTPREYALLEYLAFRSGEVVSRTEIWEHLYEFESGRASEYFQVWSGDSAVLARSPSLADKSLADEETGDTPTVRFSVLPDGRPGRQVTLVTPIRTDLEDEGEAKGARQAVVKIAVARDTLDLNQTLGRLAVLLGSVTLGASLLSVVVLIVVVRFTLKPVGALATRIGEIDASNVSDAGELACPIEELDPVVDRLNELLGRLDEAFAREKAFTADVAHELRTPLASLSAALEVCSSRPRDEAAYREVILKCLGTTRAMQSMVESLLTLARADAAQLTLQKERLDLLDFAEECWRPFESQAAERELQVQLPKDDKPIDVVTDPCMLRLVLGNLFDNAVRHADHGGTLTVEVNADSDEVAFEIRNTGCDLSPYEADKVFERFWKHDAARTEGAQHCGLGLPLCRRIAEALGGSITATIENGMFAMDLMLPRGTMAESARRTTDVNT